MLFCCLLCSHINMTCSSFPISKCVVIFLMTSKNCFVIVPMFMYQIPNRFRVFPVLPVIDSPLMSHPTS